MSLHRPMHSSQMYTVGPAISLRTSFFDSSRRTSKKDRVIRPPSRKLDGGAYFRSGVTAFASTLVEHFVDETVLFGLGCAHEKSRSMSRIPIFRLAGDGSTARSAFRGCAGFHARESRCPSPDPKNHPAAGESDARVAVHSACPWLRRTKERTHRRRLPMQIVATSRISCMVSKSPCPPSPDRPAS